MESNNYYGTNTNYPEPPKTSTGHVPQPITGKYLPPSTYVPPIENINVVAHVNAYGTLQNYIYNPAYPKEYAKPNNGECEPMMTPFCNEDQWVDIEERDNGTQTDKEKEPEKKKERNFGTQTDKEKEPEIKKEIKDDGIKFFRENYDGETFNHKFGTEDGLCCFRLWCVVLFAIILISNFILDCILNIWLVIVLIHLTADFSNLLYFCRLICHSYGRNFYQADSRTYRFWNFLNFVYTFTNFTNILYSGFFRDVYDHTHSTMKSPHHYGQFYIQIVACILISVESLRNDHLFKSCEFISVGILVPCMYLVCSIYLIAQDALTGTLLLDMILYPLLCSYGTGFVLVMIKAGIDYRQRKSSG